jgi:uncharacterized phage protein (TIGR02218 family)
VTFDADDRSIQDSEITELFAFTYPGGVIRYASGDIDIAVDADGDTIVETYVANPSSTGRIAIAQITDSGELDIELASDDPVAVLYSAGPLAGYGPPLRALEARVWHYQKVSGTTQQQWRGFVGGQSYNEGVCTLRVTSGTDDAFATEIPSVVLQRSCNVFLGSSRCTVNLTSFSTLTSVAIGGIDPTGRYITVAAGGIAGPSPYYVQGTIKNMLDGEIRGVSQQSGSVLRINLPFRNLPALGAITIVAGCNKLVNTCRDLFGNVANFRGHPHAQLANPFIVGVRNVGRRSS